MSWAARIPIAAIALLTLLAADAPRSVGDAAIVVRTPEAAPPQAPPVTAKPRDHAKGDPRETHGVFTGEYKAVLYVSDVEQSASFYRDALGFDLEGFAKSRGEVYYAEMTAAGRKFGLHEPMTEEQNARVGQQRLYFRVRDVDLHHARVAAWDAEPRAIKRTAWMDFFIVTDADGNEIAFAVTDPERHTTDPWGARP